MSNQNLITKEFLQKFKKIEQKIKEFDEIEVKLIQQTSYVEDLKKQLTEKKQQLEKIREIE